MRNNINIKSLSGCKDEYFVIIPRYLGPMEEIVKGFHIDTDGAEIKAALKDAGFLTNKVIQFKDYSKHPITV
ncbi:hypothetical protein CEXT_444141 [Caerostris extrusa]|uniref:Uncharacterized protein n=1 Tax=Caerostris extrusa TaxID=172846 RepID=A0AAV4P4Z5_CAEEX|nr:hypothetical protein CEXT_444141 [Caerostris extrusa]